MRIPDFYWRGLKWDDTQYWTTPGFPGKWIKSLNIIIVTNRAQGALGMKEAPLSISISQPKYGRDGWEEKVGTDRSGRTAWEFSDG